VCVCVCMHVYVLAGGGLDLDIWTVLMYSYHCFMFAGFIQCVRESVLWLWVSQPCVVSVTVQ
jgi:hypothetical protein